MANLIKIKRTTGNNPPATNASEFGLLSYSDGNEILYITKADGNITEVGGQGKFFKLDESTNIILQDFLIGTADASSGNSRAMRFKSEGSTNIYDASIYTSGTDLVFYDSENALNQLIIHTDDGTGTYGLSSKYGYSLDGTIVVDRKDAATGAISILNVDNINNTGTGNGLSINQGSAGFSVTSAGAASIVANGSSDTITIDATDGKVLVDGGENAAGAVQIIASGTTGNATLKIDSKGTTDQAIDITSSGGIDVSAVSTIDITSTSNSVGAVSIVENGGAGGSVVIASQQGQTAGSVHINSANGGILVDSLANTSNAINLRTNGGITESIVIESLQGTSTTTGSASIQLESLHGGVNLTSSADAADAIKLHTTGGASESIVLRSDLGTGNAISLESYSGSVNIMSSGDKAEALYFYTDGGTSDTIKIENSLGTSNSAIELTATAGGININTVANKNITLNSAGGVDIDASGTVSIDATNFNINSANPLNFGNTDLTFTAAATVKTTGGALTLDGYTGVELRKAGGLEFEINGNGDTIVHNTGGSRADANFEVKGWSRLRGGTTIGNLEFDGLNTLTAWDGLDINLNAGVGGEVNINKVDINDGTISSVIVDGSTITNNNLVYSRGDLETLACAHTATSSGANNKTWTFGGTHGLSIGQAVRVGSNITTVAAVISGTILEVSDNIPAPFSGESIYKDPDLFKVSNGAGNTKLSLDNLGNLDVVGNTVIGGNLTVNGTQTIVNSTVVSVDDATFRLGGDTTPTSATTADLGVVFPYYDTQARMGFMGWDDDRESFIFAADHVEGAVISTVQTAPISVKEIKLGDSETTMVNRSEQWQKVYEELWVNPIGEAALSGEREAPNDLSSGHLDQLLQVKSDGVGGYEFQMSSIIDGGTY